KMLEGLISLLSNSKEVLDTLVLLCILGSSWPWYLESLVKNDDLFEKAEHLPFTIFILIVLYVLFSKLIDVALTTYKIKGSLSFTGQFFLFLSLMFYLYCIVSSLIASIYWGSKILISFLSKRLVFKKSF
ncbi:MAG: hypothetical protein QW067_12175, partial [Thermofilaceae archaeon]